MIKNYFFFFLLILSFNLITGQDDGWEPVDGGWVRTGGESPQGPKPNTTINRDPFSPPPSVTSPKPSTPDPTPTPEQAPPPPPSKPLPVKPNKKETPDQKREREHGEANAAKRPGELSKPSKPDNKVWKTESNIGKEIDWGRHGWWDPPAKPELKDTEKGRIHYANGDIYDGPIEFGKMHGENGTIIYANGDIYNGGFSLGEFSGFGTYKGYSESEGKYYMVSGHWYGNNTIIGKATYEEHSDSGGSLYISGNVMNSGYELTKFNGVPDKLLVNGVEYKSDGGELVNGKIEGVWDIGTYAKIHFENGKWHSYVMSEKFTTFVEQLSVQQDLATSGKLFLVLSKYIYKLPIGSKLKPIQILLDNYNKVGFALSNAIDDWDSTTVRILKTKVRTFKKSYETFETSGYPNEIEKHFVSILNIKFTAPEFPD